MLVQDANVNNTKFCPQGVQDSGREKLLLMCLWYYENQGVSMLWAQVVNESWQKIFEAWSAR